jgi:hypothetical protein
MDAIYLLSPEPHIVDCLMADFERRRYRKSYLVWIALLHPQMRRRIDSSRNAQEQLAGFETLSVDYFPRESHLITFRDPWSFPILYHPACNELVRDHMQQLAQKVRYMRPLSKYACLNIDRSQEFAFLWANTPGSDITGQRTQHMRPAFSALTSRGLYKKSWMHTRNTIRISPLRRRDSPEFL